MFLLGALAVAGGCAKTEDRGLGTPGDAGTPAPPSTDAPVAPGSDDAAPPAAGCDGPSCKHQPLGTACASGDDCASGFCADGVCCNLVCTGACVGCNQAGSAGQCLPIEVGGADPRGVCRDEGVATCGLTGRCNGQGACARYAAGSACRPSECAAGSMVPAGTCDGRGACQTGPAISCEPYLCSGTACRNSCDGPADCVSPAACNAGSCGKRGLGQACATADDCKSGSCADGVCCNEACDSPCRSCALPQSLGRCVAVPRDAPDPRAARGVTDPARACLPQPPGSCGSSGLCDGAGGCQRFPQGTPCRAESCDPASNVHTGQFTCNGQGQCAPAAGQSCAPYRCSGLRCASGCSSDADCASPATCQAGSCGKKPVGQLCATSGECAGGQCHQGVCCSTACTGTCLSCALPGTVGVCVAVPAGAADPAGSCRDQGIASCGNDGACNGSGACRKYAAGSVCAPASCASGRATEVSLCDGLGTCVRGAGRACDPYACNDTATACFNSCTTSAQCLAPSTCQMNQCGKKGPGAPCTQPSECTTNSCADGVCCDGACTGPCESCAVAGAAGLCSPIPAGQSDPDGSCAPLCAPDGSSSQERQCDGARTCVSVDLPTPCGPYTCRAGRCLSSCAGAADCAAGNVCASMVCSPPMKKPNGAACLAGGDCVSNNCVDRTCCSSLSCATCHSCANPTGICLPVLPGTSCGPPACAADGRSTITPVCGVGGGCTPGAPASCGNYVCRNGACRTSCAGDADCAVGRCRGMRCR